MAASKGENSNGSHLFVYMCHIYFGFPNIIINKLPNKNIILHLYLFGISGNTNFNASHICFYDIILFLNNVLIFNV